MNKVFLIGRLTRDPELRYTSSQVACTTFSIAVNRTYANQNGEREADFINVVVWKKQAETAKQYLTKGSQVAIDGRIQTRNYDAQDGTKRYVTEVVAENVQFLNGGQQGGQEVTQNNGQQNVSQSNPYEEMSKQVSMDEYDTSELPF